jgi:hypothetical protein
MADLYEVLKTTVDAMAQGRVEGEKPQYDAQHRLMADAVVEVCNRMRAANVQAGLHLHKSKAVDELGKGGYIEWDIRMFGIHSAPLGCICTIPIATYADASGKLPVPLKTFEQFLAEVEMALAKFIAENS